MYEDLTNEEKTLVNSEVTNRRKSSSAVYLLWFFGGLLGLHRFYMGKTGSGLAMLLMSVIGWMTTVILIGFLILPIVGIWWFVDVFLISGWLANDAYYLEQLSVDRILKSRPVEEEEVEEVIDEYEDDEDDDFENDEWDF